MEQPIPFGPQMAPDGDPIVGAAPLAVNAIWDGAGFRRARGLSTYDEAPSTAIAATAISGLYLTATGRLIAVDSAAPNRNIYDVTAGGADSLSGADSAGGLRGTGRPVFAETEAIVAIAGGAEIQKVITTGAPLVSSLLGDTQALATHVIANNSRLLANNLTVRNRINFSSTASGSSYAGHEDWSSSSAGYIPSDARADYVNALLDSGNEVLAFGRRSVQTFSTDGTLTYASVNTQDYGCSAPYSAIRFDDGVGWLDHKRRIVLSDGRGARVVSGPIQAELDAMESIEDCYAMELYQRHVAWRFADGRTFVLDRDRNTWSLRMGWNTGTNNFQPWIGTATCIRDDSGVTCVGSSDGRILRLARTSTTDAGTDIVMDLRTGYVTRGTSARKWCKRVRFMFRGGSASGMAAIAFRDDDGAWGADREVSLTPGPSGGSLTVDLHALGVYRARQWRLRYSGAEDVVFAGAFEDFEVVAG